MQNQLHLSRFKEQAKKIKASLMRSIPSENLEDAKLLQVQEALAHAYGFRNRHEALQAAERQQASQQQSKGVQIQLAAVQAAEMPTEATTSVDTAILANERDEVDPSCAFNAAINYAIKCGTGDGGLEFLACWREGNFRAIRKEWPDAPDAVFKGADPLYGKTDV